MLLEVGTRALDFDQYESRSLLVAKAVVNFPASSVLELWVDLVEVVGIPAECPERGIHGRPGG